MNNLLRKFGGLAHGTKKTNNNEKKEYALRGELGDNLWNKLKKFETRKFL